MRFARECRRRLTILTVIGAVLVASAPAVASTTPAPASPEALALVRELPTKNFSASFLQTLRQALLMGLPQRTSLSQTEAEKIVDTILMPEFAKHNLELEQTMAQIWSARFTPTELREMRGFAGDRSPARQEAFLATPTGKKYIALQDEINRASGQAAREWGMRTSQAAFAAHPDQVRALGFDPVTGEKLAPPTP